MNAKNNRQNRTTKNKNRTILPKTDQPHSSSLKLVTRGYQKLSFAAQALNVNFRNKSIIDIGSSTGGFTQYALEHGAHKIIAVEKGTNQMIAPLRFNPAIELHEKTDIFDVSLKTFPDLILADVSFISLTKILSYAKTNLASPETDFLVMLKPQFEAKPDQLDKGIVKNSKIRRQIIQNFESWLKAHGFVIRAKIDNQLSGRHGNLERFYLLSLEKP